MLWRFMPEMGEQQPKLEDAEHATGLVEKNTMIHK